MHAWGRRSTAEAAPLVWAAAGGLDSDERDVGVEFSVRLLERFEGTPQGR